MVSFYDCFFMKRRCTAYIRADGVKAGISILRWLTLSAVSAAVHRQHSSCSPTAMVLPSDCYAIVSRKQCCRQLIA